MRRTDIVEALVAMGYKAEEQESVKNGVVYKGIVIRGEDPVAPVIYTDRLIEDAERDGKSIEDVVADVIRVYEKNKNANIDLNQIMDRDFILEHLLIGIQKESKQDLVKGICDLEGLETYLYVSDESENVGKYSIKITNAFLDQVGVSEQEAWMRAEENTFAETKVESLAKVMSEMYGFPYDEDQEDDMPIYVVSNESKLNGASCILNKEELEKIGRKHHTDQLIILPSSVHEMLVVPYRDGTDLKEMSNMVKEINESQVEPRERLTDRAYLMEL